MNRRQIEIQKVHVANEKHVIKQLKQVYIRARKDCGKKIRELSSRTDMENLQSIVFQKQYQEALVNQINGILDTLNNNSFTTIADYLALSYEDGFLGTLYDLQGQGIPLIFPIDQEAVVRALQVDSKISQGLYRRMGEDTDKLKEAIRDELSRGTANGENWNQIAARIADGMNSPFSKAYYRAFTIVRTEGHRVCQEAAYHCQQRAKSKGADVVKQWCSTLDGVTRPNHVALDNQVREVEEPFEVAGKKAMYPGAFGDPSEDCNCRCCLNQRARWRLSEEEFITKWDGDKKELVRIPAKSYDEFKKKVKEITRPQVLHCKSFEELEKYLHDKFDVSMDDTVKNLNFKSVCESIQGIENVLNEFPQARKEFKRVGTGDRGIMATGYDGLINFNPKYYKSRDDVVMALRPTGFHPRGNNVISTGSHEAGHLLEAALINKKSPDISVGLIEWKDCTQAKAVVSQACKDAKNLHGGEELRNEELKGSVSRYAKKNDSECLAEAVADYILNGKDSALLSKCIWAILKKELG